MEVINYKRLWPLCLLLVLGNCTTAEKKTYKTHTVEIRQMQFQPTELTIQKGDTVVWVNNDMVTHDVTEAPSKAWTSGPLPAGQSWRRPITSSTDYYCSIHVVMKGKITVQ